MNDIFKLFCVISSFFIVSLPSIGIAYDNELTHPNLMKRAVKVSSLDIFLQKYLDLKEKSGAEGPDTLLNGKSVLKLVQEGSKKEDEPACRAANHFHNPIAPGAWDEGKLTDPSLLISIVACNTTFPEYPYENVTSNLTWATGFTSINPDEEDFTVLERNHWDWESAREYYFTAVTGLDYDDDYDFVLAVDEEQRNEYLEKTLLAVGYVAHLLQDTSVPAHVRNDFSQGHLMINPGWTTTWIGNSYELYLSRNDQNLTAFDSPPVRSQQINYKLTDFWDTNRFDESFNGNVDMNTFGLSEYTNMNFLSEFTKFTNAFPFPKFEHVRIVEDKPNHLSVSNRKYYATTAEHPGENVGHLAIGSNLNHYIEKYRDGKPHIYMDSKCYDEYASHLIPRAVGFSADLIDYFFRGRIEFSPIYPHDLVVRGNGKGDVSIFKIKANLRNATNDQDPNSKILFTGENMQEGSLYAIAKYEIDGVVKYSLSKRLRVRSSDSNLMSDTTFLEYEFDFSLQPIPWNVTKLDIQIVFRGTLGNEKNTAVAVGLQHLFKMEISPPGKYVYSIIDAREFEPYVSGQPQEFKLIKSSVRNDLAEKTIQDGTVTAIASYRKLKTYNPDMANATPTLSADREDTISFSTSAPILIESIPSTQSTEFTFNFSNDPIPAGITDLYLYKVFEGTLHDIETGTDEPDSIVMGIKDLNEPQHLTYWNDTDYFLLNGYPRKAEELANDPNVDQDGYYYAPGSGVYIRSYIYPHNTVDSVKFFSSYHAEPADELFKFSLESGRYGRIIVLTDTPDEFNVFNKMFATGVNYIPEVGIVFRYKFSRMISQLNSDGLWYNTPITNVRGLTQHDRTYYINSWPRLYINEPLPAPDNDLIPVKATNINFQ